MEKIAFVSICSSVSESIKRHSINRVIINLFVCLVVFGIFGIAGCSDTDSDSASGPNSPFVEGPFLAAPSESPFKLSVNGKCGMESSDTMIFTPDSESDALIAVNPTNSDNIVAAFMQDLGLSTSIAASFDKGETWTEVIPQELSRCTGGVDEGFADQAIVFEKNGTLHLFALTGTFTPPWGSPVEWRFDGTMNLVSSIVAYRSTDGGLTWSGPTVISPSGDYQHQCMAATDPNIEGRVYVVWAVAYNPDAVGTGYLDDNTTYVSRSDDSGLTWSDPVKVMDASFISDMRVLTDGSIIAATTTNTSVSEDGGLTWSEMRPISIPNNTGMWNHPEAKNGLLVSGGSLNMANGPDGSLYHVGVSEPESGQVWLAKSLDKGATWEPEKMVVDSDGYVCFAHSAVAPNGNIGVMWYDTREDEPDDGKIITRVYFAVSKDDGDTWTELQVSEPFDRNLSGTGWDLYLYLGDYQSVMSLEESDFITGFTVAPPVALAGGADLQFARIIVPE